MAAEFKLSYTAQEIDERLGKIDDLAERSELPTKLSQLTNDAGFITDFTETDPTVPAWAKRQTKPTYIASEVGALPDDTFIPSALADLLEDPDHMTISEIERALWNSTTDDLAIVRNLVGNVPVSEQISGAIEEVTTAIDSKANAEHEHSEYLTQHQDISHLAEKSEIPTKVSQLTNDSNYLTTIPTEYITEQELNNKGYLTEHQSLTDYAKKTDIPAKVSAFENDAGYLIEHQDISGKADVGHKHDDLYDAKGAAEAVKNELLNGAGEAYDTLKELGDLIKENDSAIDALALVASGKADKVHYHEEYLTEHQSLAGYATETYVTTEISSALNEVKAYIDEAILGGAW